MLYLLVNKSHLNIWVDSPLLQWVPHSFTAWTSRCQRGLFSEVPWEQDGACDVILNWRVLGNHPQLGLFQVILSYIVNYHVPSMAASRSALNAGKTSETIGRPRGDSSTAEVIPCGSPKQRSLRSTRSRSPAGNESEFHPVLGWVS